MDSVRMPSFSFGSISNRNIWPPNLLCTMTLPSPTAGFDPPARAGIIVNTPRQNRKSRARLIFTAKLFFLMVLAKLSVENFLVTGLLLLVISGSEGPSAVRFRRDPHIVRAAQLLWQRVTYVGFDDRDIRGSDRATVVHVFAEIRARDRLAHLRFGLGDIGGIDEGTAIHVTDQHAHGDGNVGDGNVACATGHVHKRNRD